MKYAIITFICICFCACNTLLIHSCNRGRPGFNANTSNVIILDDSDDLITLFGSKEYQRFSGTYPSNWPSWLVLPKTFFCGTEGNAFQYNSNIRSLRAKGINADSIENTVSDFEQAFKKSSIKYELSSSPSISGESKSLTARNCPDDIEEIAVLINPSETDKSLVGVYIRIDFNIEN